MATLEDSNNPGSDFVPLETSEPDDTLEIPSIEERLSLTVPETHTCDHIRALPVLSWDRPGVKKSKSKGKGGDAAANCGCPMCSGEVGQQFIQRRRAEVAQQSRQRKLVHTKEGDNEVTKVTENLPVTDKAPPVTETPKSPSKSKKKEDKSIDHILRALNSLHTTEEKLAALCKKYADLLTEQRMTQNQQKQTERKHSVLMREKDQLQAEHNKAVMAKGKLESLCRELQKHNKQIKEESLARAKEDEEKRREVHAKFQLKLGEIQNQMTDNNDNTQKMRQENDELSAKIKKLVEKYEAQELHVKKLIQQRELESQLHDVKFQQSQMLLQEEKEFNKKEKELLILRTNEAHKQTEIHEAQEKKLRLQLELYTDKYEEFQSTLNKSNEVFGKFKSEMDMMAKRIKKLEKETEMWRSKWEASQKTLIEMSEEKQKYEQETAKLKLKNDKLASLCRALQAERNEKRAAPASGQQDVAEVTPESLTPSKTPPNTPNVPSRSSPDHTQDAGTHSSHNEDSNPKKQVPIGYEIVITVTRENSLEEEPDGAVAAGEKSTELDPQAAINDTASNASGDTDIADDTTKPGNIQKLNEVLTALSNHIHSTMQGTEASGCAEGLIPDAADSLD